MALQFEDIPIPLTAGQAGNADQALIKFPEWLGVENGEFADRDSIACVDAVTDIPITTMTGETGVGSKNPSKRRLLTHKDEILIETWAGIFRQQVDGSFALAAGSNNRKRDVMRTMRAGSSSIVEAHATPNDDWSGQYRPNAGYYSIDSATYNDYTCTVWMEQYGTAATQYQVAWLIRHKTSDAVVGRGRVRAAGGALQAGFPRVVVFGARFRIYALVNGDIGYLAIDPMSTQNVNETFTMLTALGTYNSFDVALSPTYVCISASLTTPAIQHLTFLQAAPTALVAAPFAAIPANTFCVGNTYIDTGGPGINQAFVVFYVCTGTTQTVRWYATTPAGAATGPAAQAGFTPAISRVFPMKSYTGSAANWPVLIDATTGGVVTGQNVELIRYDATSAAPGSLASGANTTVIVREHAMLSHPIAVLGGAEYSGAETSGLLLQVQYATGVGKAQYTNQVIDIAKSVTSALAGGQSTADFSVLRTFDSPSLAADVLGDAMRISTPVLTPDGGGFAAHFWCAKFTPNITNVADLGQNPTNIQRNTVDYSAPLGDIEFADLTYLAGGTPLVYDGQDVFEEGFTLYPEIMSIVAAGAGGPLSNGTYNAVAVYEWFDGQGNRWQSRPSKPYSFAAAAANTYTATLRSLRTTLKSGVQVVLYRTTAGGTIFYRDSPVGVTPLTDTALQSSELLYTGGVLTRVGFEGNDALPSVKQFCVHQNRLVAVGGEFERGFFYSKERSPRFPAEFNRASGFGQVPEATGPVAAGASVDDKLVLFATNGLSVIFGQGPTFNWTQNGYSTPVQIQSAEGIRADTPFVALVPEGVWYVTSAGPRMLTRGLATARGQDGIDLGDKIRTVNQTYVGQCQAVFVHPTKPQVYFCAADGSAARRVFIYNYLLDRWSYRNDIGDFGVAARGWAVARGSVYFLTDAAVANNPLRYIDPTVGGSTTVYLMSGWFSFAGLQRFQRWTDLQVVGGTLTKGIGATYSVEFVLYTDYDESTSVQNSTATSIAMTGANRQWQVDFQIQRQKAAAFKVVLGVTATVASKSNNFSLTGLLATVGLKRGGARLPAANRG